MVRRVELGVADLHYTENRENSAADTAGTGGERGIRTLVRVSPKHAFQACAFNHSAISPRRLNSSLAREPLSLHLFGRPEEHIAHAQVELGIRAGFGGSRGRARAHYILHRLPHS